MTRPDEHPVIADLYRRQNGQTPELKLALSIEGGGKRSVISAGMIAALESRGIGPDLFDLVTGTSGGAFNAAYYVAEQARIGTASYYEDTGRELIDFRRIMPGGRPIIDMDHMLGPVMERLKPLDVDKVIDARKLRIPAHNTTWDQVKLFGFPESREDLVVQLRASSRVPILGGTAIKIGQDKYFDAGVSEKIMLDALHEIGYDGILVLATHTPDSIRPAKTVLTAESLARKALSKVSPELSRLVLQDRNDKLAAANRLITMTRYPSSRTPHVFTIFPTSGPIEVGRLDSNPQRIIAGAKLGFLSALQALGLGGESRPFTVNGSFDQLPPNF